MLRHKPKPETQAEINAAMLRTLIDLNLALDPASKDVIARRPFFIRTYSIGWSGAILPEQCGAVAVRADLGDKDAISTNTRLGNSLSWSLRQVEIYARSGRNLNEFYESLRELDDFRHNGWTYNTTPILKLVRALGAPDPGFQIGHFTYQEPVGGVENTQVLALSGTVARVEWRAFVLPVVERLKFADGGHIEC